MTINPHSMYHHLNMDAANFIMILGWLRMSKLLPQSVGIGTLMFSSSLIFLIILIILSACSCFQKVYTLQ